MAESKEELIDRLMEKLEAKAPEVEIKRGPDLWWLRLLVAFLGLLAVVLVAPYQPEMGALFFASAYANILGATLGIMIAIRHFEKRGK